MNRDIDIKLTFEEALLVFETLVKLDEKKLLDSAVSEEERSACWALEAVLEKSLPVFSRDYSSLVEGAKKVIRGEQSKSGSSGSS
jgi:hypothetical protein